MTTFIVSDDPLVCASLREKRVLPARVGVRLTMVSGAEANERAFCVTAFASDSLRKLISSSPC